MAIQKCLICHQESETNTDSNESFICDDCFGKLISLFRVIEHPAYPDASEALKNEYSDSPALQNIVGAFDAIRQSTIDRIEREKELRAAEAVPVFLRWAPALYEVYAKVAAKFRKTALYHYIVTSINYTLHYLAAFLLPFVGFILGKIMRRQEDSDQKLCGKICVLLGVLSIIHYVALFFAVFVL